MNKFFLISTLFISANIFSMENSTTESNDKEKGSVKIINLNPNRFQEYKDLRLFALTDKPLAFGVSVKDEEIKADEYWAGMLLAASQEKDLWKLFAEVDGKLVGIISAARMWHNQEYMKHIVTIMGLYVTPEFRKQGIATKLIAALAEKLKNDTTVDQVMWLVNETQTEAIDLYKKYGCTISGCLENGMKIDNQFYKTYLMGKKRD